ncbi:MAG: cytosine permease [Terrimesophilobacter sp.]
MAESDQPEPEVGTTDDDLATALAADMENALLHTGTLRTVGGTPLRPSHESLPIDIRVNDLTHAASDPTESIEARIEFLDALGDSTNTPLAAPLPSLPPPMAPISDNRIAPFRSPEMLDDKLRMAPAPLSSPILDVPPPTKDPMPGSVEPDNVVLDTIVPELIEPMPLAPVNIGSFAITVDPPREFHEPDDLDDFDDIGDTDRAVSLENDPFPVSANGVIGAPSELSVPSGPINSPRVTTDVYAIPFEPIDARPAFDIEESGLEPTDTDQRVGRAARLFWLWFAANSSVISVAFGGVLLSLGMSLRQAIVATLIGVALSFLPLGLGTLAGKWSGQPTMMVSRASFGHLGNILPAAIALVTRIFWGALLLWFLAAGSARILARAGLGGSFGERQLTIVGLAVGFGLALTIAFVGYRLIAVATMVVSVVSGLLLVGLIAITWPAVNLSQALTIGDGPWILVLTGAVLVFSFVGLVWAVSSADLARYQRPESSGGSSMLWATFGAAVPAFFLIAYGALLAASNPDVATGLRERPLDTLAILIPTWYPVPLLTALALSLLSGVAISLYSGGFAVQALGVPIGRPSAVIVASVGLAATAVLLALTFDSFTPLLRDVATTLAVPIAAWAGIFAAEMMLRARRFDSVSLLQRGRNYADFRWVNVGVLLGASAIGFGLTTASVTWLAWQGYLFPLLNVRTDGDLAGTDLGVLVALGVGIFMPLVAGLPAIRRQELPSPTAN